MNGPLRTTAVRRTVDFPVPVAPISLRRGFQKPGIKHDNFGTYAIVIPLVVVSAAGVAMFRRINGLCRFTGEEQKLTIEAVRGAFNATGVSCPL